MRYSIQSQLMPGGPLPAESFGRIARCAAVPRPINGAATRSANEADINSREPNEALALRAVAANGFGDAVIGRTGAYAHLAAVPLHAAARMQRARADRSGDRRCRAQARLDTGSPRRRLPPSQPGARDRSGARRARRPCAARHRARSQRDSLGRARTCPRPSDPQPFDERGPSPALKPIYLTFSR